jgi:hypothetical protein
MIDAKLYVALSASDPNSGISKLVSYLALFSHDGLCINPTKSEAILFGTQPRLQHFPSIYSINISGSAVGLSDKITSLGVTL